jgi:hypothetical protein
MFSREELAVLARRRIKRFIYLPVLLNAVTAVLLIVKPYISFGFTAQH